MLADYHTHTPLCMHAEGNPEEFVDAAISAGLAEYGISDHAPVAKELEPFDDWRMSLEQLPEYIAWIERAKAHADGKIAIRAGLECDWLPNCQSHIQFLRNYHNWDYLIGAVHYIDYQGKLWDFDNPKWQEMWAQIDIANIWDTYWKTYIEMVDSGLFDIVAHPDLIKKFGYQPDVDLSQYFEPAIDAIATAGSIMEINTAGWHKPCKEQYPNIQLVELARDAGVDLIISSDAHTPQQIARDFTQAIDIAKTAGYDQLTHIDQGKRIYVSI